MSKNIFKKILDKNNNVSASRLQNLTKIEIEKILSESKCPNKENVLENLFWIINDLSDYPKKCLTCGVSIKKFLNFKHNYKTNFCCVSCMNKHPKTQEKKNKTTLRKHGKSSIWQVEKIVKKRQDTCIKRFGTPSPLHKDEKGGIRNKIKSTWNKTLGTDNPNKNKAVLSKRINTYKQNHILTIIEDNKNMAPLFNVQEYKSSDYFLKWKCKECNQEFSAKPSRAVICPTCFPKNRSKLQNSLLNDIRCFYKNNIFTDIKKPLDNKFEIDIFLSDINLGIEVNGNYWHSELKGSNKNYHINKSNFAKSKEIKLLNFFEDEVLFKRDIVLSMIKSNLNMSEHRIFARKCAIKEISKKESEIFLNANHIQGLTNRNASGFISYGLYLDNDLLCCGAFCKPRFNKNFEWELLRFATKLDYNVAGGFSKILSKFISDMNPKNLLSYADKRYSVGNVYLKNGFTFLQTTAPNYFYLHKNDYLTRINRMKFQKHKLEKQLQIFDPNLTEWENMQNNHYDRIWDCGTDVFIYSK